MTLLCIRSLWLSKRILKSRFALKTETEELPCLERNLHIKYHREVYIRDALGTCMDRALGYYANVPRRGEISLPISADQIY